MKIKKIVSAAIAAGAVASIATFATPASADVSYPHCPKSGYLCFVDYPHDKGRVKDANADWRKFGWDNRADAFYNGGRSCTARVYTGYNYSGARLNMARGHHRTWEGHYDAVSSNDWTDCR